MNKLFYGFSKANTGDEPAWFHTENAAKRFALACGWGEVEPETTHNPEIAAIMDTPERPWSLAEREEE